MRPADRMRDLPLLGAIFFFSIPLLAAEVLMLRASLIAFGPDFPYLVIPLAFFGLGAGAALSFLVPRNAWRDALVLCSFAFVLLLTAMFAGALVASSTIAPIISFGSAIAAYTAAGVIASLIFRERGESVASLYGADLSGAAVGTMLAPALLNAIGWDAVPLVLATACLSAAIFSVLARRRAAALGSMLAFVLFAALPLLHPIALQCGGVAESVTVDNAYAHLSVQTPIAKGSPIYMITYDCGATVSSIAAGTDTGGLESLTNDLSAIPIAYVAKIGRLDQVLVSAAGGGADIVRAELFGANHIDAIEIDPAVIELTKRFSDPAVDPYQRPNVSVFVDDSRHVLLERAAQYDLEFALRSGLFGTISSGADTPVYNVTIESTQELLRRLKPDGVLALARFEASGSSEVYGVHIARSFKDPVAIAAAALKGEGIDPNGKIVVIGSSETAELSLIMIKREEWSEQDLARLAALSRARGYGDPILVDPGTEPEQRILTDDRPFFTALEGSSTLAYLLIAALLALAALAWTSARKIGRVARRDTVLFAGYFAAIGGGFILFELAALVRSELVFARPDYAAAFALTCILISAGVASAFSSRLGDAPSRSTLISVFTVLTASILVLTLSPLSLLEYLLALPLPLRALAVALPLCLGGFASGAYLPYGFRLLRRTVPDDFIPWAWGVDAAAGVVGGFGAKLLFHSAGISTTLWCALGLYLIATILLVLIERRSG